MLATTLAALDLPAVLAGRFRLSGVVGCGGIAKVVRATDECTGAEVACKVMFPNLRANVELVARFRREVAIVTRLNHPNVVPILGLFEDQGHLFLAMPLMAGDLQQWLGEHGPLPLDMLASLAEDLCGAVEAAHAAGVIHRDIKPLNVMRSQQAHGEAPSFCLSDFGLARTMDLAGVTTANTLLGTP